MKLTNAFQNIWRWHHFSPRWRELFWGLHVNCPRDLSEPEQSPYSLNLAHEPPGVTGSSAPCPPQLVHGPPLPLLHLSFVRCTWPLLTASSSWNYLTYIPETRILARISSMSCHSIDHWPFNDEWSSSLRAVWVTGSLWGTTSRWHPEAVLPSRRVMRERKLPLCSVCANRAT